jgi:hypothetical protein
MKGIIVDSDFRDYYDNALQKKTIKSEGFILKRRKDKRMERKLRFDFMSNIGLKTPIYGKIKELIPTLLERDQILTDCPGIEDVFEVIVYFPEDKNNKKRLTYRKAIELYPNHFGCEYIPTSPSGIGVSWEYICIGENAFWLQHASSDDWRANKGKTRVRLSRIKKRNITLKDTMLDDCLFSVSFIILRNRMLAVNYHNSPKIKGTPIEKEMSAKDICDSIDLWNQLNSMKSKPRVA